MLCLNIGIHQSHALDVVDEVVQQLTAVRLGQWRETGQQIIVATAERDIFSTGWWISISLNLRSDGEAGELKRRQDLFSQIYVGHGYFYFPPKVNFVYNF